MIDMADRRDPSLAPDLAVRRPDPRVWREALHLADGDHRRLDVDPDGAVVVRNHKVR